MGSSTLDELPRWARSMLERARVGRLGLIDDRDRPRVLPVTFAVHGGAVYSAVDQKPKRVPAGELARVRYLRRRPEAALTVDHYEEDWGALAWVQVLGRIEIAETSREESALEALCAKYAQYRDQIPPGPLLRLMPRRVLCWRAGG